MVDGKTRVRRKNNITIDKNLNNLPEELRLTIGKEKFLYLDDSDDEIGRVLIFTTHLNLIYLENSKIWVGDGTFYAFSQEFEQIYTVQGFVRGKFFPLFYFTMERKTKKCYEKCFEFLSNNITRSPINIIIDFEIATVSFRK